MKSTTFSSDFETLRLDRLLANKLPEISREKIKAAIRAGRVSANEKVVVRPDFKIKSGVVVKVMTPIVEASEDQGLGLVPSDNLDLIFEDVDILVINKPAGLSVHKGSGRPQPTLAAKLVDLYGSGLPRNPDHDYRPGLIHRLDKDTSGLMVVAKSYAAMNRLQLEFRKSVTRLYLAQVTGEMPEIVRLGNVLSRHPVNRLKFTCDDTSQQQEKKESRPGKLAVTVAARLPQPEGLPILSPPVTASDYLTTSRNQLQQLNATSQPTWVSLSAKKNARYRALWLEPDIGSRAGYGADRAEYSLVLARLMTGRTHQIRVQLAHAGHPLIGDQLYGSKKSRDLASRQMLHACLLSLIHPVTNERMTWFSLPPEDFQERALALNISVGSDYLKKACLNAVGLTVSSLSPQNTIGDKNP